MLENTFRSMKHGIQPNNINRIKKKFISTLKGTAYKV